MRNPSPTSYRFPLILVVSGVLVAFLSLTWSREAVQSKRSGNRKQSSETRRDSEIHSRLSRSLGLTKISPEQGGGFLVNTQGYGREEDLPLLKQIEGVRAVIFQNEFRSQGWDQLGQLSDLETIICETPPFKSKERISLQELTGLRNLLIVAQNQDEEPSSNRKTGPFDDETLKPIARMHGLERLVLHSQGMTDSGLMHVRQAENLVSLEIDAPFTDQGVKALANLKNLKHLVLKGNFSDECLVHLAKLPKLQVVTLVSQSLTGEGLHHLAKLKHLKALKFRGSKDASLIDLKNWPSLELLNLSTPQTDDALLATLKECDKLKSLSLCWTSLTEDGLAHLAKLQNLEELDLRGVELTDRGIEHLLPLQNLRLLAIGHARNKELTKDGLARLSRFPRLKELNAAYLDLQSGELKYLARILSLRKINFLGGRKVREEWRRLQPDSPQLQRVRERIFAKASRLNFNIYDTSSAHSLVRWLCGEINSRQF